MFTPRSFLLLAFFVVSGAVAADELTFEKDIRPIFRAHCFDCHGATEELKGQLDLRLVRFLQRGGESGAAIEKGDAANSYLLQRIKDGEMPPGGHRVPDDQIAILEQWINAGAPTARPEPSSLGPGLGVNPEDRDYWAFRPIVRPELPSVQAVDRVRTPIDAFLLARMEPLGLTFAPDAERQTLIRRAYLDLLGLPPTPEQIAEFLADESPTAWESLIDQLLDSPHYGERWGRHWLDVAGYADSEGASDQDQPRPWAYKYRDWVIRAHQQDMPYDQFVIWQLAGDELVPRPFKNLSPVQIDQLTATGFLRMASDGTGVVDDEMTRNQVMIDTIKIVSSAFLGMSVGCAQCHDHRYDPISQVDYYRLRAVFEPALNYQKWLPPAGRRVSLYTDAEAARADEIEQEARAKEAERATKQQEFMAAALDAELAKYDEPIRRLLNEAFHTPSDARTDEQVTLLKEHPSIANLHPGVLYQYNQDSANQLKEMDNQIAAIRAKKPEEEFLRTLTEPAAEVGVPVTKLFYRGDYQQPQQDVAPGGLTVSAPAESPFQIADNDPSVPSTGRRLAYARWLTSGRHPLVARVLVNRFWLNHLGKTFVSTPDEFGRLGSSPTHPELIDWLADEFMAQGWSLKHLHRWIMRSTAYRQQSIGSGLAMQLDRANDHYSHFPVRRLEAEVVRDSLLAVSGRLDPAPFGPPAPIAADDAGQVVASGDRQRRSVYLQVRRSQPVAILKAFDAPVMEVNCARRESSTVATQALMLMNSEFILSCAKALAERVNGGVGDDVTTESDSPLALVWELAYGRPPTSDERALADEFLRAQCELLQTRDVEVPRAQAMINYCQALLSSNEFLYLD